MSEAIRICLEKNADDAVSVGHRLLLGRRFAIEPQLPGQELSKKVPELIDDHVTRS